MSDRTFNFQDPERAAEAGKLGWRHKRQGLEPHVRQVVRRVRALTDGEVAQLRAALDERDAELVEVSA